MKRFSIGLAVLLLAIGFAAFTPNKAAHKSFTYTYKYNGTSVADENDRTKYVLSSSTSGCEDIEDDMICQLQSNYAPDGSNHPNFPSGSYSVRLDTDNNGISLWQPEP